MIVRLLCNMTIKKALSRYRGMKDSPDVKLRAMEPSDIDKIYLWENDPNIWAFSYAHQPFSRHALEQFISEGSNNDIYCSRQLRLIGEVAGEGAVGCIDLYDFDPYHHRAAIGILIDCQHRRKGYATAMLHNMELFSKEHLQLHQLQCTVATDNEASLTLFHNAGFTPCGILEQWIWNHSQWTDAILFQKILL